MRPRYLRRSGGVDTRRRPGAIDRCRAATGLSMPVSCAGRREAERNRKRKERSNASSARKEKNRVQDKERKRQKRLSLLPPFMGYARAPCRGPLKGIKNLEGFFSDYPSNREVVLARALEFGAKCQAPFSRKELEDKMSQQTKEALVVPYFALRCCVCDLPELPYGRGPWLHREPRR